MHDSVYGVVADSVAPVFAPAGFDDWHASAALMTGFVAKEVVVASMAQSYSIDTGDEDEQQQCTNDSYFFHRLIEELIDLSTKVHNRQQKIYVI